MVARERQGRSLAAYDAKAQSTTRNNQHKDALMPTWSRAVTAKRGKEISFFDAGLTTLPRIASDVEMLDLNGCHLSELPDWIGDLKRLRVIYLGGNELTSLPATIGNLSNLEVLCIDRNRLTALPPEIGRLSNLRSVWADRNQLTALPSELATLLRAGLHITLNGNPLGEPLPDLVARGADALATYLANLDDAVTLYEAKVMLVGEGNVGKTSLATSLVGEDFIEGRDTTHGIEIRPIHLADSRSQHLMTIYLWDFGGQEVYRVTHQFFFSARALYLVVWKTREGQEQNDVEGWLRRIRLRVGHDAKALVIATYGDERRPELDYPRLARLFPEMLYGSFTVDNRTGSGIPTLKLAVAELVAELPQMGQRLSARWISARTAILARAAIVPEISYSEFSQICSANRLDQEQTLTLAKLMHDLGHIVYYDDDDGLRDIVVLNPEWLTKAIGYVLEDTQTRDAKGVLDHRRLRTIWTKGSVAYTGAHYPYFLRLMEKFDVSYRLEDEDDKSLVAQLVPHERPSIPWDSASPLPQGTRCLSLICKLSDVAPGLVSWLTVRHHDASIGYHWRSGVFLRHPIAGYASDALLELTGQTELRLEVRAPSPDLYFGVLRDSIEHLVRRRWPGLSYELRIPCRGKEAAGTPCEGHFPLAGLLRRRETGATTQNCLYCDTEHDIGELLTGFAVSHPSLGSELERIETEVQKIAQGVTRVAELAADSAHSLRRITKAIATEVTDCPRLFTVARGEERWLLRRILSHSYRLTLWCEQPGSWHPCPEAQYQISSPREWMESVGPYAVFVLRALRLVVPIGGAAMGVGMSMSTFELASHELDAMKAVIDELLPLAKREVARGTEGPSAEEAGSSRIGTLTLAEGQALRALRMFLFRADAARSFGGLKRAQTSTGEYIWVCSEHYSEYDPGLPTIPLQV